MAEIRRTDGRPTIDYMARDYDSILAAMRALIPDKLPEWTDHASEADFGNVLLQLFAHMGDILSYYQDRVANESYLSTARTRRSIIDHLRLIGYRLATAAPAAATLTISVPEDVTGRVTIERGSAFATRSERDRPSIRFEYNREQPFVLDLGGPSVDPVTLRELFKLDAGRKVFTLPVEEGRLIDDELLGVSNGLANQRFQLHHAPLILRSRSAVGPANQDISLITRSGPTSTPRKWVLRESLAFSHSAAGADSSEHGQPDYVVEIDEDDRATILFGDGVLGMIPEPGAQVRATYRVGGGAAGNVERGTIQTIVGAPQLALVRALVTNPEPAGGGSDRESIERAVDHAPAVFRSLHRAVTAADYEALALDFSGVGKVRARASNWNTVTLYVAPANGGLVSDVLRAGLLDYFEDRRPISTRIEINNVSYVEIYVTAEIGVLPYYSRAEVERQVRDAAGAILAFNAVDFQQALYLSRFYEVIERVEGVLYANVTELRRKDRPAAPGRPEHLVEPSGVITLSDNEVPRAPEASNPDASEYQGAIRVIVTGGGF